MDIEDLFDSQEEDFIQEYDEEAQEIINSLKKKKEGFYE